MAFGVSPVAANATSTVALVPGALSAYWGFRRDVTGDRGELLRMALPSVVGGALGALLVLWVGNRTFARVVPWLIYLATALFVAQVPLRRWLDRRIGTDAHARRRALQVAMQFFIAVYGGFFGAAMGILMLAMLGLVGHDNLSRMNGLKNFAGVCINVLAAVIFCLGGQVRWPLALAMMVGAMAGGYGAARLSRHVNPRWVRALVVVVGLGMGTYTLFKA
jgi:uncharacterized membrane protein YfcA